MKAGLTDREWWLVTDMFRRTLDAVAYTCEYTGKTPIEVARLMKGDEAGLRTAVELRLAEYKEEPDAHPR